MLGPKPCPGGLAEAAFWLQETRCKLPQGLPGGLPHWGHAAGHGSSPWLVPHGAASLPKPPNLQPQSPPPAAMPWRCHWARIAFISTVAGCTAWPHAQRSPTAATGTEARRGCGERCGLDRALPQSTRADCPPGDLGNSSEPTGWAWGVRWCCTRHRPPGGCRPWGHGARSSPNAAVAHHALTSGRPTGRAAGRPGAGQRARAEQRAWRAQRQAGQGCARHHGAVRAQGRSGERWVRCRRCRHRRCRHRRRLPLPGRAEPPGFAPAPAEQVVLVADGQVTMGGTVVKPNVRKTRKIGEHVIGGFAGGRRAGAARP